MKYLGTLILVLIFAFLTTSGKKNVGKLSFGTQDEIYFVQDIPTVLPGTGKVFLGHRITTKAFILPYYVKNNGLVIGFPNDPKKYLQLPDKQQLEILQKAGILPEKLPTPELRFADILWGFALEVFFIIGILYVLFEDKFPKKRASSVKV